jgi:hypothetical protein
MKSLLPRLLDFSVPDSSTYLTIMVLYNLFFIYISSFYIFNNLDIGIPEMALKNIFPETICGSYPKVIFSIPKLT